MKTIKDKDILEAFKLGDKDSEDKILHGVMRQEGKIVAATCWLDQVLSPLQVTSLVAT